jgi:hypothetical protein
MIIKFIKTLLANKPNTIFKVPWSIENYKEVMVKWHDFKYKEKKLIVEEEYKYLLNIMFTFHLEDSNHVMVFYSNNKDSCLCMCRYKGKHINIEMPVADIVMDSESSFVATYCPESVNEPLIK